MFKDNVTVPFEGLSADRLSKAAREKLLELIDLYVANMADGHAAVRLDEVRTFLDQAYFVWKGGIDANAVFY